MFALAVWTIVVAGVASRYPKVFKRITTPACCERCPKIFRSYRINLAGVVSRYRINLAGVVCRFRSYIINLDSSDSDSESDDYLVSGSSYSDSSDSESDHLDSDSEFDPDNDGHETDTVPDNDGPETDTESVPEMKIAI